MKSKHGITIAALIVAIIGLSIGFAAFANTLTISSSASVNPSEENFIVQFSKYSNSDATGDSNPITPTVSTSDYGENGLIPDSNKKKLQDLRATFTEPGQSVTYELYVRNTGAYVAYLKDLVFANAEHATGSETYKHCYAKTENVPDAEQATGTLVTQACNGISISVSIGSSTNITPDSASKSLGNQALSANGGYVQATITISYTGNNYVDGPMEVEFGNISFTASSTEGSNQQQEQGGQGGGQETPASNTVTLTTAQIGSHNDYEGVFTFDASDIWTSEQIEMIKNNATVNTGSPSWYHFNRIDCSDSSLVDLTDHEDSETFAQDNDNFFILAFADFGTTTYLQIQIKKNGTIMNSSNYTNSAFNDITFTITGTDS